MNKMVDETIPSEGKGTDKNCKRNAGEAIENLKGDGKAKKKPRGIDGPPVFSKTHLHRLARRNVPSGYLVSSEAIPALSALIEEVVGGIIHASLHNVSDHKTLRASDLERGLRHFHYSYFLKELSAPVSELMLASERLNQLVKNFEFEVKK